MSQPAKKSTFRAIKRACQFCKVRHMRCDGVEPCVHCEHRRIPCVYEQVYGMSSPSLGSDYAPKPDTSASNKSITTHTGGSDNHSQPEAASFKRPTKRAKLDDESSAAVGTLHMLQEGPKGIQQHNTQSPRSPSTNRSSSPQPPSAAPQFNSNTSVQGSGATLPPMHMLAPGPAAFYQTPQGPMMIPPMQYATHMGTPVQMQNVASQTTANVANYLLMQYNRAMQQFTSAQAYSALLPDQSGLLQRLLQADPSQLAAVDTQTLTKAFIECISSAHGSKHIGNTAAALSFAEGAYRILLFLLGTREKADLPSAARRSDFESNVQSICSGMELLTYFLLGHDDLLRARQISTEAYRLLTLFYPKHIAPATAHRILSLMINSSADNEDASFYLTKLKRIDLSSDPSVHASGLVSLILCLTGRYAVSTHMSAVQPRAAGDHSSATHHSNHIKEEELNFLDQVLRKIDLCEQAISKLENLPNQTADTQNLTAVYRVLSISARAITFWQLGRYAEAAALAVKVIDRGNTGSVLPCPYIQSYAFAVKIAKLSGLTDAYKRGLAVLEADAPKYPFTVKMLQDVITTASPLIGSGGESSNTQPLPVSDAPSELNRDKIASSLSVPSTPGSASSVSPPLSSLDLLSKISPAPIGYNSPSTSPGVSQAAAGPTENAPTTTQQPVITQSRFLPFRPPHMTTNPAAGPSFPGIWAGGEQIVDPTRNMNNHNLLNSAAASTHQRFDSMNAHPPTPFWPGGFM